MTPKVKSFEVKHCSIDELMLNKQLDIVDVESSFGISILRFKELIKECCEVYFVSLLKLFQTPGNPL